MKVTSVIYEPVRNGPKKRQRRFTGADWYKAARMFALEVTCRGNPSITFRGDDGREIVLYKRERTDFPNHGHVFLFHGDTIKGSVPQLLQDVESTYIGNTMEIEHALIRFSHHGCMMLILGNGQPSIVLFMWRTNDGGLNIATRGKVAKKFVERLYTK